jgi:hypothetical protein
VAILSLLVSVAWGLMKIILATASSSRVIGENILGLLDRKN